MNLSDPANLLIAGLYYVLVGLLSLFSIFGVYILIRYGKTLMLALIIAGVYAFIYLTILAQSYNTLRALLV